MKHDEENFLKQLKTSDGAFLLKHIHISRK